MNKFEGKIEQTQNCGEICKISIKVQESIFTAIIVDSNHFSLDKGAKVNLLFKETEVMLASKDSKLSASNCFLSKVSAINKGVILSQVQLSFQEETITSLITTASVERLSIKVGLEFLWFIKANEITLQRCDDV